MGSLGWPEIMVILVIALVVFGPRKLPQLGRTLGKALGEFRRATNDLKNTLEVEVHKEEEKLNAGERRRREDEYSRKAAQHKAEREQAHDSDFPPEEKPPEKPAADDAVTTDDPQPRDADKE